MLREIISAPETVAAALAGLVLTLAGAVGYVRNLRRTGGRP